MSGKNIILESGQTLFSKGDESDGMYLVRQGELVVYIQQGGPEVVLAKVVSGGMIGEMALFDQKPRSASVKALSKSEVTHITNEDFQKLMKQIPKWFTALMGTLSGRLRATNDRLQQLEAKQAQAGQAMQSVLRILNALELLWHRDGSKDGKEWVLEKQAAVVALATMFAEEAGLVEKIIKALIAEKILMIKKDSIKRDVLTLPNRGALSGFLKFFTTYLQSSGQTGALPPEACELLQAVSAYSEKAAYESFSVGLSELEVIGQKMQLRSRAQWGNYLALLAKVHPDDIQINKSSDGIAVKTKKREIKEIARNHLLIGSLFKEIQS